MDNPFLIVLVLIASVGGNIVHGMTVGFGDGSHRGPAGMCADGVITIRMGQQCLKDPILLDLVAQKANIVTEAADFGRYFIGQCQRGSRFTGRILGMQDSDISIDENIGPGSVAQLLG